MIDLTLQNKVDQIIRHLCPVILIIGSLTNTLNIFVLRRRTIRVSACSSYLLAFTISSLLCIIIRCSTQLLRSYTPTAVFLSDSFCKIEAFLVYLLPLHATLMLVFASVDRFCASSYREAYRVWSQVYLAKRVIYLSTSLTTIYFVPFLLIVYHDDTRNDCYQDSTMLHVVYLSSRVILIYIVLPIIMIIFGLLTIDNIRQQRIRVISIIANRERSRFRRNENQLTCMLLIQVGSYIVFSLPAAITYSLSSFFPTMSSSLMVVLRSLAILWQLGIFLTSFLVYILSSQMYRLECVRMFKSMGR